MKRVQAMVSGKKKQCTKVSKPEISGPVTQAGKSADSNPPGQPGGQAAKTTAGVVKPGPRSPQPGTRRAATSLETSPGVARRGNNSKIPATSPKKEGSIKRSSSPQKIRPKQDLESNSKPSKQPSKPQGLTLRIPKRPSTKDKERKSGNGSAPDASTNGVNNDVEKRPGRSNSVASNSSHKNPAEGDINQNEKPADGNAQSQVPANVPEGQRLSKMGDGEQIQETPLKQVSSSQPMDNEPRSRQPVPISATANSLISPPKRSADSVDVSQPIKNVENNRVEPKQSQSLPPPPLHGILKDSKKFNNNQPSELDIRRQENEVHDKEMQKYSQRLQYEGSSQSNQQIHSQGATNSIYRGKTDYVSHSSKPPSRVDSIGGNDKNQNHSTLPRKSALKNTLEDGHENRYNSLPRRTHNDNVPVLDQRPAQNNNANYNSWGSLDRKTESDSGFGALDRSFSSTGSSNFTHYPSQRSAAATAAAYRQKRSLNYAAPDGSDYAMIYSTGHGRPQPAYTVANQPYNPPRPDSVPPIGSKNNLSGSGDVFYDPARPGSVPPHHPSHQYGHHSETEAEPERYSRPYLQRSHRAGSVPLNYESEPAAYGYASRSNHYDSDSGRYPRYPQPRSDRAPRGLRVHPDDERYRAGPGKKLVPRRHTVGTSRASGNPAFTGGEPVSILR